MIEAKSKFSEKVEMKDREIGDHTRLIERLENENEQLFTELNKHKLEVETLLETKTELEG